MDALYVATFRSSCTNADSIWKSIHRKGFEIWNHVDRIMETSPVTSCSTHVESVLSWPRPSVDYSNPCNQIGFGQR